MTNQYELAQDVHTLHATLIERLDALASKMDTLIQIQKDQVASLSNCRYDLFYYDGR